MTTTQRRVIILAASLTCIVVVILLIMRPWLRPAPTKQYQAGDTVMYTDAVTGKSNVDIPGESGSQASDVLFAPGATVNGLEDLKTYLNTDQFLYVSSTISSFLLAHSGSSVVSAGIRQATIAQSNNKLIFTLAADRPQADYRVTIDTSDTQSPTVTIERVE